MQDGNFTTAHDWGRCRRNRADTASGGHAALADSMMVIRCPVAVAFGLTLAYRAREIPRGVTVLKLCAAHITCGQRRFHARLDIAKH